MTRSRERSRPTVELESSEVDAIAIGVDFDILDDDSVAHGSVEPEALRIKDFSFTTVILPSCDRLETDTAQRLLEFVEAGGRLIVVGRPPAASAGRSGDDTVVGALAAHPGVTRLADAHELPQTLSGTSSFISADSPVRARRAAGEGVAFVPAAFPNASAYPLRTDTWLWHDYDFDPSRYRPSATVHIAAELSDVEIWNPATGERRPARTTPTADGTDIHVDFRGAPALFVAWREGVRAPTAAPAGGPVLQTMPLDDGWDGALVPTLDNTWGDFARPASPTPADLEIWSMDWAETLEPGRPTEPWRRVKVGFGNEVLTLGPLSLDDTVPPLTGSAIESIRAGRADLGGDHPGWRTRVHSSTRGIEKDRTSPLGPKGRVPEEFVTVESPDAGEAAQIRTLIQLPDSGTYEIIIGAAAAKQLWVNGSRVGVDDGAYLLRATVELPHRLNVLEYRVGADERPPGLSLTKDRRTMGTFHAVAAPGTFPDRPEFIHPRPDLDIGDAVTYRTVLDIPSAVAAATLVTGAASALEVRIDGLPVARQEKVEYYESEWGADPMFFSHDLTSALSPGRHILELVSFTDDTRNGVYADLIVRHADGTVSAVVSSPAWTLDDGSHPEPLRGRSSELASCFAAQRPHPLAGAHWLTPEIDLGTTTLALPSTTHTHAAFQVFRFEVPAGTTGFTVPTTCPVTVSVNGTTCEIVGEYVDLGSPLQRPGSVQVSTTERARFGTGGSAWREHVSVRTALAPMPMGDLRELGLASWSGGIRYTRRLAGGSAGSVILDLGRVRGSVTVDVDGRSVGTAFCQPYTFDLGDQLRTAGEHDVAVTVYNTLGPYLNAASPTPWIFPSQLQSGILGPVTLTAAPTTTAYIPLETTP